MKRRRLELPRQNSHYPLKVARLPIPPPLQMFVFNLWCPEQDSNLHVVKHTHLKRARLPIPPLGLRSHPPVLVHSESRAENGTRTRDPDLGKVVLYQLSYFRNISLTFRRSCPEPSGLFSQYFFDLWKVVSRTIGTIFAIVNAKLNKNLKSEI